MLVNIGGFQTTYEIIEFVSDDGHCVSLHGPCVADSFTDVLSCNFDTFINVVN